MRTKTILMTLVACCAGTVVCLAAGPEMGKWKLNEAKSQIAAGAPKLTMVTYEAAGDSVKVTVDGVGAAGKPTHSTWTGKYDGKDYPLTGDTTADTRSYTKVDEHTLAITSKKGGKAVNSGRAVVAADGKTRKVTMSGTDSSGKKITSTSEYDKQ